jgi:Na+/proline symporter
MTTGAARILSWLLIILGLCCVIAGILYFVEPAKSLPSFFPGHVVGLAGKRTKHGIAAVIVGVLLWAVAWLVAGVAGRNRSRYPSRGRSYR